MHRNRRGTGDGGSRRNLRPGDTSCGARGRGRKGKSAENDNIPTVNGIQDSGEEDRDQSGSG